MSVVYKLQVKSLNDYTFPESSIFMSDWPKGINPVSQSSSKTEDNFIFESYSEWWSSMGTPRIFRSSVKLWLLFRYGSVSPNNDNGGWFFINKDDNEDCELVDKLEGWPKMLVRSCWFDGTAIAGIGNHWQKLWAYDCFRTDFEHLERFSVAVSLRIFTPFYINPHFIIISLKIEISFDLYLKKYATVSNS